MICIKKVIEVASKLDNKKKGSSKQDDEIAKVN